MNEGELNTNEIALCQKPQTALLILGMHRSGTSAYTSGLEKLAGDLGPNLIAR